MARATAKAERPGPNNQPEQPVAPKGNQRARKHGLHAQDMPAAVEAEYKSLLAELPDDLPRRARAVVRSLARVRVRAERLAMYLEEHGEFGPGGRERQQVKALTTATEQEIRLEEALERLIEHERKKGSKQPPVPVPKSEDRALALAEVLARQGAIPMTPGLRDAIKRKEQLQAENAALEKRINAQAAEFDLPPNTPEGGDK
jgi:uncharacterized protein YjcR